MLKFYPIIAVLLLMGGAAVQAAETAATETARKELFAIAAEGQEPSAEITHLTGRAPFYHIYDENGNLIEVLPNAYLANEVNIGPDMAALLADRHVTVLVGGMAGPKMRDVMDARGIRFVFRKGIVQNVVDELRK
jgi:predicted Fe-Mo cluster-binding NifX family protein